MRVICIENKVNKLPINIINNYSTSYSEFPIIIEKNYIVYGMMVHLGVVWYYIADEHYCYYPLCRPSLLFDVIDDNISRYWVYSFKKGNHTGKTPLWTFPEWARDPDFYDRLTDWEEEEIAIFRRYKELMDLEFEDPSVTEYAQQEEDGWLICKSCFEAWQSFNTLDALIKCPQCEKILNNPSYIKSDYSLTRPF